MQKLFINNNHFVHILINYVFALCVLKLQILHLNRIRSNITVYLAHYLKDTTDAATCSLKVCEQGSWSRNKSPIRHCRLESKSVHPHSLTNNEFDCREPQNPSQRREPYPTSGPGNLWGPTNGEINNTYYIYILHIHITYIYIHIYKHTVYILNMMEESLSCSQHIN